MLKFNNTQAIKHSRILEMKTCATVTNWDVSNGNKSLAIIGVLCPKLLCFGSRSFLAASYDDAMHDNQAVELFLQCAALNRMIQLGKPDTYKVEG
jgi:hypothetical protein